MQVNNINKTAENILHHPMREAEEIGKKRHKLATQLRTEKKTTPGRTHSIGVVAKEKLPNTARFQQPQQKNPPNTNRAVCTRERTEKNTSKKKNFERTKISFKRRKATNGKWTLFASVSNLSCFPLVGCHSCQPHKQVFVFDRTAELVWDSASCDVFSPASQVVFAKRKSIFLRSFLLNSKQGESCLLHFDFPIGALNSSFVLPRIQPFVQSFDGSEIGKESFFFPS